MGSVIWLDRHRGTERPGTSVGGLFSEMQAAVESEHEVRLSPWYWRKLSRARWLPLARRWLKDCDLLITTNGTLLEVRQAAGLNLPVVLLPLGSLPRGEPGFRCAFPLLRRQDVVALSSEADRGIFRLNFDDCPAHVVLPFGVDTDVFRPAPPAQREDFRRCYGIRSTDVLFLSVGRITAEKNVQALLELFAIVVRRHPNARLAIGGPFSDLPFKEFGTGPFDLRALFERILAARPEVKARTILLGEVHPSNVASLYGAADVFINLTRHHDENFGYAQVEAMASGLPVIGTDWGGLKDTIRHGETGLKVPTWVTGRGIQIDLFRAFQHCQALIRSPALRRRMGKAGRAVAQAEYSLGRFRRNVLDLVARALETPRGRASRAALSPFGRKFAGAFGRHPPVFTARTYPLYEQLIRPYATGPVDLRPPPDGAMLFSTPLSYRLDGEHVEITDVLWPARLRLGDGERALLGWYRREAPGRGQPFIPVGEARRALARRLPAPRFDRAILGLMRKGVLLTSPGEPEVIQP